MAGLREFWRRISAGLTVQELWSQFRREAHSSMAVYAGDVRQTDESSRKHGFRLLIALFRAMFEKLSPPRRVLLLISLLLLCITGGTRRGADNDEVTVDFPGPLLGGIGLTFLLALELADRVSMKRDLEIARDIQNMLLPAAPPTMEGVDIAFATRPANTVAGDYYDAFARPASPDAAGQPRLMLLVADVAGKGIPAGMLMATLQANVRAFAEEPVLLLDLVTRLNRVSCTRSGGGRRFTTAFFAELDLDSLSLEYVNAGHNPPILMRKAGGVEHLEKGGLPLGVMPAARFETGHVTMAAGDALYVYTDGVIEAVNDAGEEYGDGRLDSLLLKQTDLNAADRLASLFSSIKFFTGAAAQYDDITCLVLRVMATARPSVVREFATSSNRA